MVEIGTLTPKPQPGNPKPRLFRLVEDKGVVNRYGFNNGGLDAGLARAKAARRKGVLGINVGANKDTADRIADYRHGVTQRHRSPITSRSTSPAPTRRACATCNMARRSPNCWPRRARRRAGCRCS